jgi:ATP-dependent Lhr-like helicase
MEAHVRNSKKKTGQVPSWQGGRMPLSSQLSAMLRRKIQEVKEGNLSDKELSFLQPLFDLQLKHSAIPGNNELLIEYFETAEGYHLLIYPFEGRSVHEGLGALLAYRIGQIKPLSFSIGMTDYGVELLSAEPIPIAEALEENVLSLENLLTDIQASINSTEMAKRKFRDIAAISGLIFKGYPGQQIKDRHLQSSTQLFFNVFADYESSNLLLQQAYSEVLEFQLEETRLRQALARMAKQKIILKEPERPTPFSFPIMVDRLREKLSTESLEAQVKKMVQQYQQ